jgi:hypothetical protein
MEIYFDESLYMTNIYHDILWRYKCMKHILVCYSLARVFLWWNVLERRSSSFSEGRKPEWRSRTFFPGIGITNTPPSNQIVGNSMHSSTYLFRKITLICEVNQSGYTPWRSLGGRVDIAPTHSRPWHQMGLSGQCHAPARLYPQGKDPRYTLDKRLGGPQSQSWHRG